MNERTPKEGKAVAEATQNAPEVKQRIGYIDFLKFIGLTGIIIAHVGSPDWLMMLRNFDVPLMVILSSVLGERSYRKFAGNGITSGIDFFISRFKRLVIPTWTFLTIFFAAMYLLDGGFQSVEYYIASYCLTGYGISYVWIIRIYLFSAVLIPVFYRLKLSAKGILIVALAYVLYEIAYYFRICTDNKVIYTVLYYIIPYGALTYLGVNYYRMSRKTRIVIGASAFAVFAVMGIYYWISTGSPESVEIAKYPPRLYYLAYGAGCSLLLMLICEKHELKIYENRLIKYISKHSMWIYLWHIMALTGYELLGLPEIWYIKLAGVYALALLAVLAVNKVLDCLERYVKVEFFKYLRA